MRRPGAAQLPPPNPGRRPTIPTRFPLPLLCRSYRARRREDGRVVALKVTDLSRLTAWSRQAAVREAQVLAALPHPCLTAFREAFALGSRLCIATEAAPGGDLRRLLE